RFSAAQWSCVYHFFTQQPIHGQVAYTLDGVRQPNGGWEYFPLSGPLQYGKYYKFTVTEDRPIHTLHMTLSGMTSGGSTTYGVVDWVGVGSCSVSPPPP